MAHVSSRSIWHRRFHPLTGATAIARRIAASVGVHRPSMSGIRAAFLGSSAVSPDTAPKTSLNVRAAGPADDEAIGEFLIQAFRAAYARKLPHVVISDERVRALRAVAEKRANAHVWVAEQDGRMVGTVSLFPPGAPGTEAWIPRAANLRHLATHPGVHGQGLSKPLLDMAEKTARDTDSSAICLHIRRDAQGLGRLYKKRGYARDPAADRHLTACDLDAYVLRLGSIAARK